MRNTPLIAVLAITTLATVHARCAGGVAHDRVDREWDLLESMIDSHLWDGGHQTSSRHCGVFNVAGATPMMRLRSGFLAAMALDLRDFELRAGILVRRRRLRQRQRQRQRSGRLADPGRPRQPRSGRASPSAFPIDAAQTAGGSPETFQGTLTLGSLDAPADAIQVQVVLDVLPAPGS